MYGTIRHPVLVVVRGIPGSGKSHLAAQLQEAIGRDNTVLLDPDTIDFESDAYSTHTQALAAEGVDAALHAYRFLRAQAYAAIDEHKIILWNQPFTNLDIFNKMIGRLQSHAAESGTELSVVVVEVAIDPAVARARVQDRKLAGGHGPSSQTLTKRIEEYKSFANEGYDVVTVRGDDDVVRSVATVLQVVGRL